MTLKLLESIELDYIDFLQGWIQDILKWGSYV